MKPRKLTLAQAQGQYPHRFTMEHVPNWAETHPTPRHSGGDADWFYAPQYRTDQEWYANTLFPGEGDKDVREHYCESRNQSWPLGQQLSAPYTKPQEVSK